RLFPQEMEFHAPQHLDSVTREVARVPRERESGTVEGWFANDPLQAIPATNQFQLEPVPVLAHELFNGDLGENDVADRCHGGSDVELGTKVDLTRLGI